MQEPLQVFPLIKAIEESADQYAFPDSIKGYGIPDFCMAHTILTGISQNSLPVESFNVYPNPFQTDIEIAFYSNKKQNLQIAIYDIAGRKINNFTRIVYAGISNKFALCGTEDFCSGIYIIQVISEDKSYFKKIIKK